MVVLTEEMVLAKTRAEDLSSVKNLNLWGSDLSDVSILQRLTNVEVLSLSVNKIRSLQEFRYCTHLTELYLRKNEIADIREVAYLQGLKSLSILWLCDNPCVGSSPPEYRRRVIAMLPNITKLDNVDVGEEERIAATQAEFLSPRGPPPSANNREKQPQAVPSSKAVVPKSSVSNGIAGNGSHHVKTSNVLSAVMLLLRDLDPESLTLVRGEVDKLLSKSLGRILKSTLCPSDTSFSQSHMLPADGVGTDTLYLARASKRLATSQGRCYETLYQGVVTIVATDASTVQVKAYIHANRRKAAVPTLFFGEEVEEDTHQGVA